MNKNTESETEQFAIGLLRKGTWHTVPAVLKQAELIAEEITHAK